MIKVLSLFSGIGAFEKALKRVGIDYELVNYCEIDKYASKSYSKIHNVSEDLNLWDITTVDTNKLQRNIDLLTHGSPCQDFSLAGKQAGGDRDSGTRSSLMYETIRIVKDIKPKIIVWENVKNVLSKKHKHNFDAYTESLNELGYNNYYRVLNATDYGIPQNRERIFVVSIRSDIDFRNFEFSKVKPLNKTFIDMLENDVDKKFYMSQKCIEKMKRFMPNECDLNICPTLTTELAHGTGKNLYPKIYKIFVQSNITPRILTPKECFRLMGFDDEDFERAEKVCSNTQLYKQTDNSIVVNVLETIFDCLKPYLT